VRRSSFYGCPAETGKKTKQTAAVIATTYFGMRPRRQETLSRDEIPADP
jgi:hypothetical protein